jgi:uncharacterized protein YkwD
MRTVAKTIVLLIVLIVVKHWWSGLPSVPVVRDSTPGHGSRISGPLDPTDAFRLEKMVVDQINQDRAAYGLPPVTWDPVAAAAAMQHVQEEADEGYISHWGMDGSKPQLRYTRAGGLDVVQENESVSLFDQGMAGVTIEEIGREVIKHEALMMAEPAGDDGHKKNILNPHHTGVGVAIAAGRHGIAMAEEFTNHYTTMTPLPRVALPGSVIILQGKIHRTVELAYILATWEEAPHPMTLLALKQTHSYSDPPVADTHFWAGPGASTMFLDTANGRLRGVDLVPGPDGSFRLPVPLSRSPGLDYITLYVKQQTGEPFPAFQWVVDIRETRPEP